jgi:hypothetical protein
MNTCQTFATHVTSSAIPTGPVRLS